MQKRVLAFLLVLAMVFSLLPVALVGAEEATADPGYVLITQKAHNQTEGSLAIDIYLQANTAGQADVTGYQFTVTPAEGVTVTGAKDATGNDGLVGSGNTFIYTPGSTALQVGTSRVLVATVTVTAESLPAQAGEAITLTEATVTTAEAAFVPTTATVAVNDTWADVTGEWLPLDVETVAAASSQLKDANYYLVENITVTKQIVCSNVNLDLNGYTLAQSAAADLIAANTGKFLTISDYTATGSALDGTLKAGTLKAGNSSYGGAVYAHRGSTLTVSNVNIDATAVKGIDCGYLLYCVGQDGTTAGGKLIANNVYLFGGTYGTQGKNDKGEQLNNPVDMADVRGDMELNNVRFADFVLEDNDGSATENSLISARHSANYGNLILNNVVADSCGAYSVIAMNKNNNRFASLTIKGDTKLADPVYLAEGAKITLDLGENASVIIETEKDKTAETLGEAVVIPKGAALPEGAVLYNNTGDYVSYKDGSISFNSHAHAAITFCEGTEDEHTVEGMSFKAWSDPDALPLEGNWFLTTDVVLTADVNISNTLNLDLNGHDIDRKGSTKGRIYVYGVLNLFDCQAGYDADGNYTGGSITGGKNVTGPGVYVSRSNATKYGVFNLYSGRISGNGANVKGTSGSAVYVAGATANADGTVKTHGAEFNMYGGELCNNLCGQNAGAVTVYGFSPNATSGTKGTARSLNVGAVFNMYGGKIYGNVNANDTYDNEDDTDDTSADGTIFVVHDATFNMKGGEISGNTARRGGAIYVDNAAVVNISGGTISDNHARQGGAIFVKVNGSVVNITGGTFKNNVADTYGGAIHCQNADVNISEGLFTGNTAQNRGGAIHVEYANANLTVTGGTFDGNIAEYKGGASTSGGLGSGGAISVYSKAVAEVSNAKVVNNKAIKNQCTSDYSGLGAAFFVEGAVTITLDNCEVTGNEAVGYGSFLASRDTNSSVATDDPVVTIKDCVATGNSGKGTIYTLRTGTLTLDGTEITNNISSLGPVYITAKSDTVILKGDVKLGGDKTSAGVVRDYGLQFQDSNLRTAVPVQIDELTEGAHVAIYYGNKDYNTDLTADKVVKIVEGGSQTDWNCGWLSYSTDNATYQNIHYAAGEFSFGHFHNVDGQMVEYTGISALPTAEQIAAAKAASADGVARFYLIKDVSSEAAYTLPDSMTLCMNGNVVTSEARAIVINNNSHTFTMDDCTAVYGSDGAYVAGGLTSTGNVDYGGLVRIDSNGGHFVLNEGRLFGVNKTRSDSTAGGATAIYANNASATIVINGGEICDNHITVTFSGKNSTVTPVIQLNKNGATLDINGGIIRNNSVTVKGGAYISADSGNTLTVKQTTIAGSLVYAAGTSCKITIDDCLIEGNVATAEGGANVYGGVYGGTTTINNSVFKNNKVESASTTFTATTAVDKETGKLLTTTVGASYGGAMCNYSGSTTTITNSQFIGNSASTSGGAIYVRYGTLNATNVEFVDNYSGGRGGAVYAYGKNGSNNAATKVTLTGCEFTENGAKDYAGAVYVANLTTLTADATSFTGNTSKTGGAIYSANSVAVMSFTNCEFTANEATSSAGAIYADYYKTLDVKGCTFKENISAGTGGAMRIRGNASAVATVGGAGDEGNTFIGNIAKGAAIYFNAEGATVTVEGSSFTENVSSGPVSALRVEGKTNVTVKDTTIQNNTAVSHGALFVATASCKLILEGKVVVTDNISEDRVNDSADLFFQNKTGNNAFVDASGLTEGSKIGVDTYDERTKEDPVITTGGSAAVKDYFFLNNEDRLILHTQTVDGTAELALVKHVDENGVGYGTVQAAVEAAEAAGETTFVLQTDSTSETVNLDGITTIDLDGHDLKGVKVAEGKTLTLIDSQTNDYDVADGVYGKITTIEGDYNAFAQVNGKRYAVIADENGKLSAHRVYLAISTKTLRPERDGVGFKAIFAGDEVVTNSGIVYGIELSGYADFNQVMKAGFDTMEAGAATSTPNQKNVIITNAISAENVSRWDADLYGRPFMTINGETHYGATVTVNMKTMATNAMNGNDEEIKTLVQAMMDRCGVSIN